MVLSGIKFYFKLCNVIFVVQLQQLNERRTIKGIRGETLENSR